LSLPEIAGMTFNVMGNFNFTNYGTGVALYGAYEVDVDKCTKNVLTTKKNQKEIMFIIAEEWVGPPPSYYNYTAFLCCPINKKLYPYGTNTQWYSEHGAKDYTDNNIQNVIASFYGCQVGNSRLIGIGKDFAEWMLENLTSYHLDPVYVDKTLVNFTDGTYIVRDGALDATKARSEGYKQLLNTYGTFYKGTERELAESFAQNLSLLNGGG
jgi:hypothetical protein